MTAGRDDDALSWDGDDDPTLDAGTPRVTDEPATLPAGYTPVGRGSETVGRTTADVEPPADAPGGAASVVAPADPAQTRPSMGTAALVALGALGGIYLLLSVGWLIGAGRLNVIAQLFLDPIAFQVTVILAVVAPPLWFGTTLLLTRRPAIRFTVLAVGAVLLIPWPFVMAGALL